MGKRPEGRPPKFSPERISEIMEEFDTYIMETDTPIIAEFAGMIGATKSYFYDHKEFSDLIKRCTTKKEGALERGALNGTSNVTMSIFSLKQLGWTDKQEISSTTTNIDATGMTPEERRKRIQELLGESDGDDNEEYR